MDLNVIEEHTFQTDLTLDSWAVHIDHERGIVPVDGYPELYGFVCWGCEKILLVGYEEISGMFLWQKEPTNLVEAITIIETKAVEHTKEMGALGK